VLVKRVLPVLFSLIAAFVSIRPAFAQVSLTSLGTPHTQNFDALPVSGSATWTNNSTIPGWFHARTGTGTTVVANNGSNNAGNLYSYGTGTATERALGSVGSGNAAVGNLFWGVRLQNNTGATITSLQIAYTGEQWRNSAAAAQSLVFSYLVGSPSVNGSLAEFQNAGTVVSQLEFVSPTTGGTAGPLDGNLAANRVALSHTITGLSIPNGTEIMLRWSDPDHTGADHGLAIDDLSVTAQGGGGGPVTPTLSINDISAAEGNVGTTNFNFLVSLTTAAGPGGVSFTIGTADNTATAPGDYASRSVNHTIPQGSTSYTFTVEVNGDTTVEPNETFFVNITGLTGANAGDLQGQGTILNDDVSLISISAIQGTGISSPLAGQAVTTQGVVTARVSNGFYIQDATGDANPATSDGILVFTSSAPPSQAAVGNLVQVTGTVLEFVPSQDPNSRPITELISPTVVQISSGNPLPAPAILNGTFTAAGGPDQLERFEGMRVQVNGLTVVAPTDGTVDEPTATADPNGVFFAVVTGTPIPLREAGIEVLDPKPLCAAGAGCAIPTFDANPERLRVDSDGAGLTGLNVSTGNTISSLTGVLTYGFRSYTILPTHAATVSGTPVTASPLPVPGAGTVTIATMNVERLFDTVDDPDGDPLVTATAYQGRLQKISNTIRNVLRFPDVIAFQEIEKLQVLADLSTRITADAGPAGQANPAYVPYLVEGNDVGGIDVGFLVKTGVSVTDVTQLGFTTQYDTTCGGTDTLNDRPPLRLRGSATKSGQTMAFTVFVNHLRSLNGIDDESACNNGPRVRAKRAAQADFLAQQIQDELNINPAARIIAVGDFNAFEVNDGYVDVLGGITGTPSPATQVVRATADPTYANLTNMLSLLPGAQRYSYVFDGNHQTLDHLLLNPAARASVVGGGYARVNADHPESLRADFTRPERYSDHDPGMVYLTTATPVAVGMTRSGVVYNRVALTATSTITMTNTTSGPLTGPLSLVITGLPAGVTLTNAGANNGAGYVYNLTTPLAPGQSVAIPLSFSLTSVQAINYTATVFQGSI